MRYVTLQEYRTELGVPLSAEECDILRTTVPSLSIAPSIGSSGCYDITPGSVIGAVALEDLGIEIRPKIPIARVLFLLGYSIDPSRWRDIGFHFGEASSVFEAVIPGFVSQVRRATVRGLLKSYRQEEEALTTVRGRVRLDEQIRKRYGIVPPIEVRYDEFTEDVEENRLLKAALSRLSRLRIRSEPARRLLFQFEHLFGQVELVAYEPGSLPRILYTRLNQHYGPAVELARLILRSASFELSHGNVRASVFLVDMNDIFENFIVVALREQLGLSEETFTQGARGKGLYLDEGRLVRLEPDLSWWEGSRCVFVGDAKYKRVVVQGVEHSDLYQLLAYTAAADLPSGLLVYAAGEGKTASHQVIRLGKRLEVRSLDLNGSPESILKEVARIAHLIREQRAAGLA